MSVEYTDASEVPPYIAHTMHVVEVLNRICVGEFFAVAVPVEGGDDEGRGPNGMMLVYTAGDPDHRDELIPIGIIATQEEARLFMDALEVNENGDGSDEATRGSDSP